MRVIRTARRTLTFAAALAAGLSAAALAVPAVALASSATPTAGAPAAGAHRAVPAARNAMAGYVWFGGGALDPYYDYSTTGRPIAVTPTGTGLYTVVFGGMASIATKASVQLTTYRLSTPAVNCTVVRWFASGGNLEIHVACHTMTSGAPADAKFTLIVTRPASAPHGTFAYAWDNRSSTSGALTTYQYNSSGRPISSRHLGTGRYEVTFGGPSSTGTAGVVKVSPYGGLPGDCEVAGWHGSAAGEVVDVDCFSGTSGTHVLADRRFVVTYAATANLMGLTNTTTANVFADGTAPVYQPLVQYDSQAGARVTVVHYDKGYYEVLPAGSQGNKALGGDVQVSAVGSTGAHCISDGWGHELTPSLYVRCFDRHGNLADSPFTVEWVVP